MDYGALIQAAVTAIGELAAKGERDKAEALLTRMRTEFEGIPLPDLEEIEAIQLGPSAMEGVSTDPSLEAAQLQSLGQIGDVADNGLADVDKALLNKLANQVSRRQRAGMANIEGDMAARGLAGSGMDYALRASNAQDANQRLSEAGQNIGADSLERRLKAAYGRGEMAGKVRGQSFDEKSSRARAIDEINRQNAAARSQAQYHNAALPQQRFANQMQKTGAMANPTHALVANYNNNATSATNAAGAYGAAAGAFADSLDDDDEDKKKK